MDKYYGRFVFDCVAICLVGCITQWLLGQEGVPYTTGGAVFATLCMRLDDIARKLDNNKKENV